MQNLSKEKLRSLAKLKQKKQRLSEGLVIVEGQRILDQLAEWNIHPQELYVSSNETRFQAPAVYSVSESAMERLCDSETPPQMAGLFSLPQPRKQDFSLAFYLEEISDPGNLGTIFRSAAAFNVECLILSPKCCEISSPKVIRASLGAVYKVPFFYSEPEDLEVLQAQLLYLDMDGKTELSDFKPKGKTILAIGNEAHGISQTLKAISQGSLKIYMPGSMESLNAAVSFAITAYSLCRI